jgi:hypothetical protein
MGASLGSRVAGLLPSAVPVHSMVGRAWPLGMDRGRGRAAYAGHDPPPPRRRHQ